MVRDERLLRLREAHLPRCTGVLDRGQRARACAAVGAADVDDVRVRLRHARGDDADARLGDELRTRRHAGSLAQVEDQLREILDRVDVVVRRRRDERDARLCLAETCDLLAHLVRRDLAPSPGFEPCAILIWSSSANAAYSAVTPKPPDATCLIAELLVAEAAESSPPSPEFDLAPSR